MVAGSALLLIIWVRAKWLMIASKSALLSKWKKLAILIANHHNSNSVME